MHAVYCATAGVGGYGGKQRGVRNAKTGFFAFHVSAGVHLARALIGAREQRIASCFRPIGGGHTGKKQDRHGRPHRPAVALRSGHAAKCVSQPGRNRKNQHHLKKVRERSRIFKRMGAVGVKEPSTVGAEFLDHFL